MQVETEERVEFVGEGGLLEERVRQVAVRRVQDQRVEQHRPVRVIQGTHELFGQAQCLPLSVQRLDGRRQRQGRRVLGLEHERERLDVGPERLVEAKTFAVVPVARVYLHFIIKFNTHPTIIAHS